MRRDPLPLLVVLLLTLLGSVAWFTRDPDSPALQWLTERPVIGPLAERFREIYRPAAKPTEPTVVEPAVEVVVIGRETGAPPPPGPVTSTARPLGSAWVKAGTELLEAPAEGSAVVETVAGIRTMTVMEQRGDWRRVARYDMNGERSEGWVRLEDLGEPSVDELWRPEPVVPLAAVPPPEEILAQARTLMGDDARQAPCGPFLLITDVEGVLVERCSRLAGQLDELYGTRTGLEPVSGAAEAILLFDSHAAFLVFRTRVSPESTRHAFASPARGFVALAAGGRLVEQVQATLVHELVHLLNRRYLGPALPSWLDEGLAEELAMSRIEADGSLVPGSLGRWEAGPAKARLMGGGEVERSGLRASMRRGDLPTLEELAGLDSTAFQADARFQLHYALSAFWMRYLLSGESSAGVAGFREFLAAVAEGQPLDGQLLLSRLDSGWSELETGFRQWLATSGSSSRQAEPPSA